MNKNELTKRIRADRARLDGLVASIDLAALDDRYVGRGAIEPSVNDGPSVKDILAHISAWERLCAGWLEAVSRGETPERPEVRDVDGFNAATLAASRDRPLADVLAESRASYQAIMAAIDQTPDAELKSDTRFGWPTWQMVSANTDDHYREHIEQVIWWWRDRNG